MQINGVFNVLKPTGTTSFDICSYIRRLVGEKKVGHCGTLDPAASGVLPVCVGSAVGLSEYLSSSDKSYRAEILFGVKTDSIDLDGNVIRAQRVGAPDRQTLENVLSSFIGKQYQTPPMFSAIKKGGKRLYELARKGVEIDREPREIIIFEIKLVRLIGARAIIDVNCSKGTYIRSLCEDVGKKLSIDACMSFLIRTCTAGLRIENSFIPERLELLKSSGRLEEALLPIESLLPDLPDCALSNAQLKKFINGVDINVDEIEYIQPIGECKENCLIRVFAFTSDKECVFYALGKVLADNGCYKLRIKKLFRKGERST